MNLLTEIRESGYSFSEIDIFKRAFHHAKFDNYKKLAKWAHDRYLADGRLPEEVTNYCIDLLADTQEESMKRVHPDSVSGYQE
jgi:hypothetical protein